MKLIILKENELNAIEDAITDIERCRGEAYMRAGDHPDYPEGDEIYQALQVIKKITNPRRRKIKEELYKLDVNDVYDFLYQKIDRDYPQNIKDKSIMDSWREKNKEALSRLHEKELFEVIEEVADYLETEIRFKGRLEKELNEEIHRANTEISYLITDDGLARIMKEDNDEGE